MLFSLYDAHDTSMAAVDGPIGNVEDFLFDDRSWHLRYAVVRTGTWLGRTVLIGTPALRRVELGRRQLVTDLTRDQVKKSPDIYSDKPISRQQELALYGHYGWAPYFGWSSTTGGSHGPIPEGPVAVAPPPRTTTTEQTRAEFDSASRENSDPHLRSAQEVINYYIRAEDGEIGHVEDFIGDEEEWVIRYAVVDTVNWLPGRKVLVPARRVESINWADRTVWVRLTRDEIRNSPEYNRVHLAELGQRALSYWQ